MSLLIRISTKDYPVPGTNTVLPSGSTVFIPAYAFHHDPKYYPEPEVFKPERFTAEAKLARDNVAFLAFGDGPRNCIGARFGLMQARVGLVTLLLNYEFARSAETPVPMVFDNKNFILSPLDGLKLNLKKI